MCYLMLLLFLSFYFSEKNIFTCIAFGYPLLPGGSPQNYGALLNQTKKRSSSLPSSRRKNCHQLTLQTLQSGRKA